MSVQNQATREIRAKGYHADSEGNVYAPSGKRRKLRTHLKKKIPYLMFNATSPSHGRVGIYVHKLVAYQKFGESALQPGIVVRHLDGDSTNNSDANIAIGTNSDNMMDRPPEARRAHALKAAAAKRRLTAEQVASVIAAHAAKVPQKQIALRLGVPRSTICELLQGKIYSEVSGIPYRPRPTHAPTVLDSKQETT